MLEQIKPARRITQLQKTAALVFVCGIPFWFSFPTLNDPYGQTEEAVNNAVWALGGRNIIHQGPWAAKLGAVVAPFPGTGGGIYAHHPPLPIWISGILQLVTARELAPRAVALFLMGVSLALLFSILRRYVSDEASLLSVALVSLSPWVLIFSRMLTTLTLATPLFLLLLRSVSKRLNGEPFWNAGVLLTIAALTFSSWDGFIGASALVAVLSALELRDAYRNGGSWLRWVRALAPAFVLLASLILVLAYLINANGGTRELIGVGIWRTGVREFPLRLLVRRETLYTANGIGWATVALMLPAVIWSLKTPRPRQFLTVGLLSAAPGLGMVLLFRNGALNHEFWGYNLFIPAAFGLAMVIDRVWSDFPKAVAIALLFVLGVQAVISASYSASQLERHHQSNALGGFLKGTFANRKIDRVRLFWGYDFHPYVAWYLKVPHEVVYSAEDVRRTLTSGHWHANDLVLTDNYYAHYIHCDGFSRLVESENGLWSITSAGDLEKSCQDH